MPESFDVFVSYKREDQAFAEILRERLSVWGHKAWMDKYNIPAGAYWPDEIDRGLNASKVVIGILSPRAVVSRNVKNEWDWAIVNGKRLLLLMIEPCKVPMNYVSINYIDCVKDQTTGLAHLQAVLTNPTSPVLYTDPYRGYLQALYDRINTYLAQTIIKVRSDDPNMPEPISLQSERTRGAVDALFEKRDEIDPLFMIGGVKQEMVKLDGDFRAAFEYFDGRILLLGEPGAGKTITLLQFARDAVVQRIQDPAKPLPILAIIPTWDAREQTPLVDWLANSYGTPSDVAQLVAEGRALLLLDGLDELGRELTIEEEDPRTQKKILVHHDPRKRFMAIIPVNNQVIVTCRLKDYEEIGEKLALEGAVTLKKLTDEQIRDYLVTEMSDLWTALETDEELRDVARTPLLLSLFAFAYRYANAEDRRKLRRLRESPGELRDAIFERYVKNRYEHEARKPYPNLLFTPRQINRILERAAVRAGRENTLPQNTFEILLDKKQSPAFAELVTRLHFLVYRDNSFRFIHSLLRDHFAFGYCNRNLQDTNWGLRFDAVTVLGSVEDPRVFQLLFRALNDPVSYVSISAALSLLASDTSSAIPILTEIVNNVASPIRIYVTVALGRYYRGIGKLDSALEYLLIVLQEKPDWEDIHQDIMMIYYQQGLRTKAIAQYRELEKTLAIMFGVKPTKDTCRLYEIIDSS